MNDPGWPPLRKSLHGIFTPGLAIRRAQRAPDGLLVLRSLFISFCTSVVLVGVVTVVLASSMDGDFSPALGVMLTAAAGVVAQTVVKSLERPLDCTSDQALAGSYRTRFFLRLAFSEVAALVGFVLSILSASVLPYFIGMVGALAGFARLAPTAAHLEADQQVLTTKGCALSLVTALRNGLTRTP